MYWTWNMGSSNTLIECAHLKDFKDFICIFHHNSTPALGILSHYFKSIVTKHDDVIKWNHFPRYCPFVWGIHRSPVNSPHNGQWRGALIVSLICVWLNGCVNNREAGDLRRYRVHFDVIVMSWMYMEQKHWDGSTTLWFTPITMMSQTRFGMFFKHPDPMLQGYRLKIQYSGD